MKRLRFFAISFALFMMAAQVSALAADCRAICIQVRSAGYGFTSVTYYQTMSESASTRERALEKLEGRCDERGEHLVIDYRMLAGRVV